MVVALLPVRRRDDVLANRPRARHRQDGALDRQGNESMDQLKHFCDGGYVGSPAMQDGEVAGVLRPGERWLVKEPSQLDRIEAKLDMLIDALAEDEPEQEQQFDLDGNAIEQGEDNGGAL